MLESATKVHEMSPPHRVGWLEAAGRLQRVGFVLARHGFGEVVSRIGVIVPRLPGGAAPMPSRERMAQRLADVFTDLGPTYIKLGQLLATRSDLFPPEFTKALGSLHASVRTLPYEDVKRIVETEYGSTLGSTFASFDERALAAASIGQVHRARLFDGSEVVVKVQRPGLRLVVEADLAIMRRLAGLLAQHVPEVAAYDPVALVEAFARSIRQELDFRTEAENAARLREVLRGAPEVCVPRIHESFTRERVLVMEFVAGRRLSEVDEAQKPAYRAAILRAFVRQTVEHGVFHADPHPGNMLALPDGRVALLDLGTIDVLDERLRSRIMRLGVVLALGMRRALAEAVVEIARSDEPPGKAAPAVDHEVLGEEIGVVLKGASSGGSAMVGQMFQMSRTHGLRLPSALLALMRALAILDGVLRGLDPKSDLVRDIKREVAWATLRRVRASIVRGVRRLFGAAGDFFENLAEKRLKKR